MSDNRIHGDRIPGYRIEGELGQGGMASVFLALQESLNRSVALKVMAPALSADRDFRTRFLNEGRIVAQLGHGHIVTVYDIGCHDNLHYLSMEYLPGGTLRERIRAGLPLDQALRIAEALAGALHYAHQRGFIHRDVKPLNVLFREDDTPVLTDFGIAKVLGADSQLTRTGFAVGSVGYMSPEQALGRPIDQRADIYAFGVLFWELLVGKAPYEATDAFALALKHATAPLPELPPTLARFQPLCERLLAKQPEERYTGLDEFIRDLKRDLNSDVSEPAVSGSPPGSGPEWGATVIRAAPTGVAVENVTVPEALLGIESATTALSSALSLVEREQQRLLMRLPDYIEALRIPEADEAGTHLGLCDELLQSASRLIGDYLQTLGIRSMSVADFDRLHTAMDRHARLGTLAGQIVEFGRLALSPIRGDSLRDLRDNMIEGLDAILLILRDAVQEQDAEALAMARMITGDRSEMMQKLRQSYLTDATRGLDNSDKMLLLKLTGQFERLIWALGALVQRL